jgi:hypothetical protein
MAITARLAPPDGHCLPPRSGRSRSSKLCGSAPHHRQQFSTVWHSHHTDPEYGVPENLAVDDRLKETTIGIDCRGDSVGLSNAHYQFGGGVFGSIRSFRMFVAIHSFVGGRKPISFGKTLGRTGAAESDSGCEP